LYLGYQSSSVSRAEAENATLFAFAREDAEGFACNITLLEDELVAERGAQEVSEMERWAQFEVLTLLQTWGFELCHAIVGPPQVRHHQSEGMRLAALRHTKMAGELAVLQVMVSTAAELVHEHSPSDTFCVEVVSELAAKFQKMEDQCSQLECLPWGFATYSLGCHSVGLDWLII
jgi:hypothetical protein